MQFRLSGMTLQGKVAVANLLLIASCVKIEMAEVFPWGGWADQMVSFALSALSFPLGWLSFLMIRNRLMTCLSLGLLIPANAYLWGYLVTVAARWRRRRQPGQRLVEFRLYRLTLQGKIAMGILGTICVLLAVAHVMYPAHHIYKAGCPSGSRIFSTPVGWGIAVLTFPLGWVSAEVSDIMRRCWTISMTACLILLNAYLWGFIVASSVRWCNRDK
jgi:CDP-diglyceride synthetase